MNNKSNDFRNRKNNDKNQDEKFDEIDTILYDYFENDKEIPISTQNIIDNAFELKKSKEKHKLYIDYKVKKAAIILIAFGLMSTSIVFADDFVCFIASLFSNSTDAINLAVQNNYVQNVNMDYIYDNNIGIKVDNIILDGMKLDISFDYKFQDDNISLPIEIDKYILKDENNNIIFDNSGDLLYNPNLVSTYIRYNRPDLIYENVYDESILYSFSKESRINKIYFEINSVKVKRGDDYEVINGTWKFDISLNEILTNRNNKIYECQYDNYVENMSAILMETTFVVDIDLKKEIDESIVCLDENVCLKDKNNNKYRYFALRSENILKGDKNEGKIHIEYDFSKYYKNIEELNLCIKFQKDKKIDLKLIKQ